MKKTMIEIVLLLLAAFSPVLGLPAGAMVEEGIIDQVQGQVQIQSPEGAVRPAQAGMLVQGGEIVETAVQSSARILLPDESVIELKENSRIEINDSRANARAISSVLLYLGWIWADIAVGQDGDTAFEVVTPSAVAGIRGTVFSAGVGIDGSTRVGVEKGVVEVEGETGSVSVKAEEETSVELGSAPGPVSPYRRGEDEWRQWAAGRQQVLMRRADVFPGLIARNVRTTQGRFAAQAAELKREQRRWDAYERRQQLRGREARVTPAVKREVIRQFREMYRLSRQLQRADNRMMAGYYLIERLDQDLQAHPDQYSPEFRAKIRETRQELDALDLPRIHRQNLALLDAYATGMEEAVGRLNLNPELRRRIEGARRRQRLEELRRQPLPQRLKQNQP
ncbi:MAG: hypothetical protein A2V67_18220 [Deltaproteobacteria bacterium RBG_13_61_14]|nr:MAG: hypothetical protein A2V67_18220 [Deltaproteobacteria bacterium RBG_13_61_14]